MFGSVLSWGPTRKDSWRCNDAQKGDRATSLIWEARRPQVGQYVCAASRARVQRSKGVGGFVRVDTADRLFGFARVIASAFFFAARERVIGFFMVCVFSGSHTFTKSNRAKTNAASI